MLTHVHLYIHGGEESRRKDLHAPAPLISFFGGRFLVVGTSILLECKDQLLIAELSREKRAAEHHGLKNVVNYPLEKTW